MCVHLFVFVCIHKYGYKWNYINYMYLKSRAIKGKLIGYVHVPIWLWRGLKALGNNNSYSRNVFLNLISSLFPSRWTKYMSFTSHMVTINFQYDQNFSETSLNDQFNFCTMVNIAKFKNNQPNNGAFKFCACETAGVQ